MPEATAVSTMREQPRADATKQPSASTEISAATRFRSFTLAITVIGLVLRLVVAVVVARTSSAQWLFSQATELGCLANSLLQGNGFSSPFCGQTGPSAFLAPGYPLLVAAVFRIFGPYTMHAAVCIVFTQALFGAAAIPVTMWAARNAFGTRVANITGVLCAINPWLIGLEAVLWETSLSILLMTALVGLAVALRQKPSRRLWYAAALAMAAAALVNPSLVLTGLALLTAAAVLGKKPLRHAWLGPAVLFFCLCSLWPARNFKVLHAFIPLRSNMGYELWQGNRPDADGFFQAKLHPNVNAVEYGRYKEAGEVAYMQEKSSLAKVWIRNHPQRFATLTLKRMACFWLGVGRTPSALVISSTALLSLIGFVALYRLFRDGNSLALIFAVPLLLLPLPYYISHPDFRFWCLLAPTLTLLGSWWAVRVWENYLGEETTILERPGHRGDRLTSIPSSEAQDLYSSRMLETNS